MLVGHRQLWKLEEIKQIANRRAIPWNVGRAPRGGVGEVVSAAVGDGGEIPVALDAKGWAHALIWRSKARGHPSEFKNSLGAVELSGIPLDYYNRVTVVRILRGSCPRSFLE